MDEENNLMIPRAGKIINLSVVKTPISDYIVVDHDPFKAGAPKDDFFVFEKYSYCMSVNPIPWNGLAMRQKEILMQRPDFPISEDISTLGLYTIPSGTIGELLSKTNINALADRYQAEEYKLLSQVPVENILGGYPKHRAYINLAVRTINKMIYSQLIRNSAPNHLQLEHKFRPSIIEVSDKWVTIIDDRHSSNCGYAPANAFMYKIIGKEGSSQEGFFPHNNMVVQEYETLKFQFLSGMAVAEVMSWSEEKRNKDRLFVRIGGNPAIFYPNRDG